MRYRIRHFQLLLSCDHSKMLAPYDNQNSNMLAKLLTVKDVKLFTMLAYIVPDVSLHPIPC